MASYKLSELTGVTSTADESLIYVADTQDSGSSFSGRKIAKSALLNGFATETYVNTAISDLVDGAPVALDTLNELAAALNDDASAAASLTALINANETHIDNLATLTGVAKDATILGSFVINPPCSITRASLPHTDSGFPSSPSLHAFPILASVLAALLQPTTGPVQFHSALW